ncbi:DNA-3-methyladenine glycosylase I [Hymenobacter sp.]|uniref:DNA-3-methyladenine glycosylase I n=1 Tax=Hymenobacter sp. TaxID=1898978 RepID=UPI00286B8855|nr:DNA-3-methyladenine glycosylase I [Hymenobacter sp.]
MSACPQFSHDEFTRAYHAHEWGEPVSDPIILFEYVVLHTFQAGLPLHWVLKRREAFRDALCNFEPARLARFSEDDVAEFLLNPRVIRNRRKAETTRQNAQAWLRLRTEEGGDAGLLRFFYGFVGGRPVVNRWATAAEVPATAPAGDALARELKSRGFGLLGPFGGYSLLQTAGLVNDHLLTCPRHSECAQLVAEWEPG